MKSRILELDGLRTFAISSVLFFHFGQHSGRFVMGWVGVDLFFVISGFLITGILLDLRSDPAPYRTFYWRRVLRIFPPYYAVLAIVAAVALVLHEPFDRWRWMEALFFLPAIHNGISLHLIFQRLLGRAAFDHATAGFLYPEQYRLLFVDGMRVYWSLAVEELFYLLWAPIVLKAGKRWVAILAIAALFGCPVLRGLTHTVNWYEASGFITRFDSLAIGACITLLLRSKPNVKVRYLLLPIPLLLGLLTWLCLHCGVLQGIEIRSTELFSIFGYTLIALLFACIVAACVQSRHHPTLALLRWKPMVYIGTISYTMYLTHLFIYVAATRLVSGDLPAALAAAFGTVTIAALSWRYFENPILRLRNLVGTRPLAMAPASPQ